MKTSRVIRAVIAIFIILATSYAINRFDNGWIGIVYATVLAFFPSEIKALVKKVIGFTYSKQTRVVCSYLFRIMYANKFYLLVDERGENVYAPVGGVYKFDATNLDIGVTFEGEYDGIHGTSDDTENDLRLKISSRKVKDFFQWFDNGKNRENASNLLREFREELIDTEILDADLFKMLTYSYIGSHKSASKHSSLGIPQILRHDIFSVQLTDKQQAAVKKCARQTQGHIAYIFATQEEIEQGYFDHGSGIHKISPAARLVVVSNASELNKDSGLKRIYTAKL